MRRPFPYRVRVYEMAYFSIPLELAATVYVQAPTLPKAHAKLQKIVGNQIDALDQRWFSDAPLGSGTLPEVSFASAMSIRWPEPGMECESIDFEQVKCLLRPNPAARKCTVIPRSRDRFGNGDSLVFQALLTVKTIAIIEARDKVDANGLILNKTWIPVYWADLANWFTASGFSDQKFPLVLSPTITVFCVTAGAGLEQTWPEDAGCDEDEDSEDCEDDFQMSFGAEVEIVAERLRTHFHSSGDCRENLGNSELLQLAEAVLDYRKRRLEDGTWPFEA